MLKSVYHTFMSKRHLPALASKIRIKVIAIDGRYDGFMSSKAPYFSTDGSYELVNEFRDRIIQIGQNNVFEIINQRMYFDQPKYSEADKRQMYVSMAASVGCDFLLIMDSDEFFFYLDDINWVKFYRELRDIILVYNDSKKNVFGVCIVDSWQDNYTKFTPRLWYRPRDMHYYGGHNKFKRKDSEDYQTGAIARNIDPSIIKITHDYRSCRCPKRQEAEVEYLYNTRR